MKIALCGGCFNPIHYGHLILAETAREYFNLDRIIFIPAGNPPHKVYDLAPAKDRYQMVKLATQNNQYFLVSLFEIKNKDKSYTYKTINFFKRKYPKDELFFLVGSDALLEIDSWKKGKKILDFCPFLVGMRPGFSTEKIEKEIIKKVTIFPFSGLDISGKEIRKRIYQGKSIKYFLPEKVKNYIYKNWLYAKK